MLNIDAIIHVPTRTVIGPIAFFRILTKLAEHPTPGAEAQETRPTPVEVKEFLANITGPEITKALLVPARKQVAELRKSANAMVSSSRILARQNYRGVAELASTLIHFDEASGKKWTSELTGIWKELIFTLGNMCEMSLRLQEYERALCFGAVTLDIAEKAPEGEKVLEDVLAKNRRRLEEAKRHIEAYSGQE